MQPEFLEQQRVSRFRRHVAGQCMVERVAAKLGQRRHRGGTHEAIEQGRNAQMPRGQRRAQDGGKLAAAQRRRHTQRIVQNRSVPGQRPVDHLALALEAGIVDAGAIAGETRAAAAAAEQSRRHGRGRGGVADAHLAQHHEIGVGRKRLIARRDRGEKFRLAHGRCHGEIRGRLVERQRDDAKLGARLACQLIDGGAAGREIRHHLRRDLGGIGRDALRGDAVIAGEYEDLDLAEPRRASPLPEAEPGHGLLETAQAPRRFGQRAFAARHRGGGVRVALGKVEASRVEIGKGGKAGHLGVDYRRSRPISGAKRGTGG